MKKIKVKIYKDPKGNGRYINKTSKFLQKAQAGMQVTDTEVDQDILDQLTLTNDVDEIADNVSQKYGVNYFDALDKVERIVEFLFKEDVQDTKNEILTQDKFLDEPVVKKPSLYTLDEEWASSDDSGWDDFDEESQEEDDLAAEDQAGLSVEKKGGTVNKKKFVKNIVTGLKKAAEGMQQDQSSNASILDTPTDGRQSFINTFRRGVKDLGNEFYAKEIYDKTKELQNQVRSLPSIPMAEEGIQMQEQDIENPMHHLEAYAGSVSNIFKQPMNQVHGAGFENIPEARKGREQRQADRQERQMNKDWRGMFGDMAAGYAGVPGMPNYLQVVTPQFVSPQVTTQGAPQGNQGSTGPFVDIDFKKGPWWKGTREWSAKGIPAEMLMGMSGGRGRGVMPGYGYMPGGVNYGTSSSWSTQRTFPGEIIRTKSSSINAAADPAKNKESANLKNSGTKPYAGYMELNAAPPGTEMVYDAQGNEVEAISPEEAARRKATAAQSPWMFGAGTTDFIPTAVPSVGSGPSAPVVTNMIPQTTGTASGAGVDRFNLELISSPTKPGTYYGKDATGVLYQFSGDIAQHTLGKEPIGRIAPGSPTYEQVMGSIYMKQYGGAAVGMMPDQYGNLQKFIYGGGDDVSPIVSYEDNYINSKNTDDPFMFRNGGMFQYQGPQQSQVSPGTTTQPGAAPATWKDLTEADYKTKLEEERKKWEADYAKKQQQSQTQTQTRTQTQGGYYPQGNYGYPTAPKPFQQVMDMFSPFKRNPQTGRNYDFNWFEQQGPARTLDGRVYQPQGQPGQTQNQTTAQGQTTTQGQGTNQQPTKQQAGYMYDYKLEKGPWWSGKKTMTLTGKWYDPNNPNAGAQPGATNAGQFNNGKGPTLDAGTKGTGTSNFTQSADGKSAMSYDIKNQGAASSTTPTQPSAFPPGDPRGEYMKSQLTVPVKPPVPEQMPAGFPANTSGPRVTEEDQMGYGGYMAYGGYVPEFNPGGQFSGAGPFDPNANNVAGGIGQGGTGPCTEFEVQDPNSPCYDPNYKPKSLQNPEDFEVKYDINTARTLSGTGIANLGMLAGNVAQGISGANENAYNENYMKSNISDSLNREPVNELDYRGGYSGLNQRIMSKTQGAGATGFNSVVGNAAFVKKGGQLEYRQGGVYDLTQEEIGQILASGGQIKFIK